MISYLECPCCGCEGATSDAEGWFEDGQELECGCLGHVSADSDGDWSEAYILINDDDPCPVCEGAAPKAAPGSARGGD